MSADPTPTPSQASSVAAATGIAWQIGVLAGLRAANVTFSDADAVNRDLRWQLRRATLASGYNLQHIFDAQFTDNDTEVAQLPLRR